ncbi:PREDICTED: LOW QUALITY PROTEIN: thioredoxin domain-containing protein 11 [Chrysochloris asiatica]|uniref:LOW QUALITY PROTEIN: thioredoxin domain-containing protein 11 n=1 Tax=Chrysochloris asiatica TaxID=185453 RepID=A0A9B0TV64_CHRAS|nr:PREDICTED: LOW QUALITY PROTEIN: thioredoxin domain-containing protein 11 [Chrysochloris asiatica]
MSECGGRGGGSSSSSDETEDEGGGGGGGPAGSGSGSVSPASAGASSEGRLRRGLRGASLMARRRPELLCGAVALGCALLFALKFTCSRAKDVILPAKPPVSFFSSRSPVLDLFQGQLDHAEHIRRDSEVVLLFFYAPWCGQSISARAEIEQAASRLSDQVLFVAINCWWNQGKCRKQKHFFYFPVIYLYHRSFGPIEYKGPMSAVYIEKFVRRVMKPLLYIPSQSELLDFLSNYEPGVLGYFEFNGSPQPPGYLTFFTSALHSLKKDYLGTVRFGVITNKHLAKLVSLVHSGSVYLHRHFNTSLVFPREIMNYTAENICTWALENREMLFRWLRPHGGKSLLLNNELKKGPALFLFIPFDPLAESHPLIDEITEVALEYNNCHGDQVVERLLQHLRRVDAPAFQSLAPELPAQLPDPPRIHVTTSPCCNTVVLPQWRAISRTHNVCELCVNQTTGGITPSSVGGPPCSFFEMAAALDSFYLKEQTFYHVASDSIECSNFLSSYNPFSYYSACCRTISRGVPGFIDSAQEAFESPAISFSSLEKKCEADSPSSVPHIEETRFLFPEVLDVGSTLFTGLSCRTNKTLNIYLLDSNLFWLYAERLGAPSVTRAKEFAAIVDVKEEAHYILDPKQALMKCTLESFIQNFSVLYSPLKRHLIGSDSAQFPSQHLITEVTTDTFWEVVLQKQDVLLLYYAQWCGFCLSLNHIFIQLARLLPADTFTVARINVAQNDLPWEFMVDRLPTVLFFPCNRKDLSVKYPEDVPITLPNLLKFILHYSSPMSTAQSLASAPTKDCLQSEAALQQGHISHLEREIQKLRAELGALHRVQVQVEVQLAGARRDEHRLLRQKQTLEDQHQLLRQHSSQLQTLYQQKTRELEEVARKLQELADASEDLLTENTWLKILVATMERRLQDRGSANKLAPPQNPEEPAGAPRLTGSTPPPSNDSATLVAERSNDNRTD